DESAIAFAPHKTGRRRVILREWLDNSPIACVFARSASSTSGLRHGPHAHKVDYPRCCIDIHGRIVTAVPLAAKKKDLDHITATCDEPDPVVPRVVLSAPSLRRSPS